MVVNEAADICGLRSLYSSPMDTWHSLDSPTLGQPALWHAGGGAQANTGEICGRGAVKTLVLSGTHSFTFLLGSVESHSHLVNCNCYYEVKHAIVRRWDLHCVRRTSWVIDRNPWCGVYTIVRLHTAELKCLSVVERSRTDLPYRISYSRLFNLSVIVVMWIFAMARQRNSDATHLFFTHLRGD